MLLTLLSWIYIMVLTVIPGLSFCVLLLRPAAGRGWPGTQSGENAGEGIQTGKEAHAGTRSGVGAGVRTRLSGRQDTTHMRHMSQDDADAESPSSERAVPHLPAFATPEVWLLTGLALAAVYAQIYSLFGGVGWAANALLILIGAGLVCCLYRKGAEDLREERGRLHSVRSFPARLCPVQSLPVRLVLCAAVVIFLAAVTAQTPTHYDTYLYHAQAIHWIEEYGCVIGLGNLHNRFAYNSSFLVLQALFSLKFMTGSSLHTLNGYVAALFLCYCLCSLKAVRKKGLFLSDGLRAGLVYYLLHNSTYLSSPNTDTFALSLAFYIFIKWCDCLEEGEDHAWPYAWLCLMAVFACTLKLSSAFLLVLLIKPICMIFRREPADRRRAGSPAGDAAERTAARRRVAAGKTFPVGEKTGGMEEEGQGQGPGSAKGPACGGEVSGRTAEQESAGTGSAKGPACGGEASGRMAEQGNPGRHPWRQFAFYAGCAIVVAAPYFIRNVLLSGYVLYPYSFLDIIPFADWKMDAGVLDYDRLEIMAWGRAIYDVTQMNQPVTQWLPSWFAEQNSVGKREILIAAVSAAGLLVTDAVLTIQWFLMKSLKDAPMRDFHPQIDAGANASEVSLEDGSDDPSSNSRLLHSQQSVDRIGEFACANSPRGAFAGANASEVRKMPEGAERLPDIEKTSISEQLSGNERAAADREFPDRVAAEEIPSAINRRNGAEACRWCLSDWLLLSLASVFCLAGWLLSAPLLRYGEVYLIIVSAIFVLYWMQRIFLAGKGAFAAGLLRAGQLWGLVAMLLVLLRGGMMQLAYYPNGLTLQYQDYLIYDCGEVSWEEMTIYIPSDGTTQTGYEPFPAVFSEDTLEELELRGEDLEDGIRRRE